MEFGDIAGKGTIPVLFVMGIILLLVSWTLGAIIIACAVACALMGALNESGIMDILGGQSG